MTSYPYEAEVQLLGYAWNPDDGPWARFRFDSDVEMSGGPHPFHGLSKGREKGQRFRIRFDLIADDETETSKDDAPDEPYLLEGQILVGEEFIWEPNSPHARAHIIVTRIDDDVIWSRRYAGGDEFWNDKSRFREAAHRHSHSGPPATPDEPVKLKGGPLAKQAGILCATPAFQDFLRLNDPTESVWAQHAMKRHMGMEGWKDVAAEVVRDYCGLKKSRAELDHNLTAAQTWKELTDAYYASQRGETTDAFEVMKGEGPG